MKLSVAGDRYSHLVFIPVISAAVAHIDRKRIFREARYCPRIGVPALVLGARGAVFGLVRPYSLSVSIAALVGVWIAAFVLRYGP